MAKTNLPEDVRAFFVEQGSRGGKIGGKKRMAGLTAEQRTELAHKAVTARMKKVKSNAAARKGSRRTSG